MVPLKLQLRNFMCYRGSNNTIDFTGIHLACLTGDNGHGKSALLDAMTWALWGKARARRDDDLISHGETEMEVHLDFDLAGEQYRVIRKRSAAGRGSSVLELQGRTAAGYFTSLSEATIRESQLRINRLLRLEYDTFVNSAFLLQGRADEFTTRKPAERKQILADILDLAQYEAYEERARAKAKVAEERRVQAERDLQQIQEQVEQIPTIQEELTEAEARTGTLALQLREAMECLQKLQDERRALDSKADARTQAERQAQEIRGELIKLEGRVTEQRGKLERYDALLIRAEEIEGAMKALEQARAEKEHWDELREKSLELSQEVDAFQKQIDQARTALEKELGVAETTIKHCHTTLNRYSSRERELVEAQKQIAVLEKRGQERDELQQLLVERTQSSGQLQAENNTLKKAMNDLKERMELLGSSDEAMCPVCRRDLSEEARAEALDDAQQEGKRMGDRYRENQREMKQTTNEIESLRASIDRVSKELAEMGRWQQRAANASQAAEEMNRAREELNRTEQQATALRAQLEAGEYAHEAQTRLTQLASAATSLGYDKANHEAARESIQRLSPRKNDFDALSAARKDRSHATEMIQALEEQYRHLQQKASVTEQEIQRLTEELLQLGEILRQVQTQQALVNTLQRDRNNAERFLGGVRQRLEFAEQHAARQPQVEALYHEAVEKRALHEQLAQAFGKRGLQAMLIESALPEIEMVANELLGKMTDGRMTVSLVTQRESRAGDAIETLDILIADESGERPYETFSGGEAFRVNFALRIALSKLLAQRAGTTLRTLIIDEGFGSQDAQGRERIIEAITSIQEDFDRILVITHLEDLKDAFPVRIDIVKGEQGSRVRIN
ncbi:MAG: SMC family ATPase [Ardenticatenales bacterium]|nr:SMC family ATPase [Ardenticatenales bacterium]